MDTEVLNNDEIPQVNTSNPRQTLRTKSSQRLLYEAEVEIFKKKVGDLEEIRIHLGLSQRKICQLLLVDPSAWTRWTKKGERPPPHIYRSLQWYLGLLDKYPEFKNPYWLSTVANMKDQKTLTWEKDKTNFLDRTRREVFGFQQNIDQKLNTQLNINKILMGVIVVLVLKSLFFK